MSYGSLNTAKRTTDSCSPANDGPDDQAQSSSSSVNYEEESKWIAASKSFRNGVSQFYDRNFGLFLVLLAQVFGSLVRLRMEPRYLDGLANSMRIDDHVD